MLIKRSLSSRAWLGVVAVALAASVLLVPGARPTQAQDDSSGVATISGKFTVSNPFVLEDYAEPFIALIDLTAFIKRDKDMPLPFPDQTVGSVTGDPTKSTKEIGKDIVDIIVNNGVNEIKKMTAERRGTATK